MSDTNTQPTDPNRLTGSREPDVLVTGELKEENVFRTLVANFRDAFFPEKLPPLVLESTPIYVADPMATKMTKKSVGMSVAFYALLMLLLWFLIRNHVQISAPLHKEMVLADIKLPPKLPHAKDAIGGGGGAHDNAPVTQGHLPKLVQQQIVPPKAPPTIPPKLAVEPSVVVQPDLKMATNTMPNMGMPNSSLKGYSLGNGSGGGIGSGSGTGIGPGSGGNTGGGVYHVGGGVSEPKLLKEVEPEFSEEARKAKFSGNVEVYLFIDPNGNPTHVRCARDIGMGLCGKAVDAVRQYKFKPAMKDGKPVTVDMYIDVNFQIF
ncbi:MAG: energy transducer TonB [Bryocella sp.]